MRLLQRKIFSELIQVFALSLLIILSLILMGRALQISDMLFGLDMSALDIALLFVFLSPTFMQIAAPIACMISVYVVFLRLENDKELMAIRAGGISLYELFPVPLFFSLLVMFATLWLSLYGMSWGMYSFRDKLLDVATTQAKVVLEPGVFNKDIPNLVLYTQQVDPISGELKEILVQDTSINTGDEMNSGLTILAPNGIIDTDRDSAELLFLLKNGIIYSLEDKSSTIVNFREYVVRIPLSLLFSGFSLDPIDFGEMSFKELLDISYDELLVENQDYAYDLRVEINRRLVFPFSCLILGIIAMPMAIASSGVKKQRSIMLTMGFFAMYFGFISLAINLGKGGVVNPYYGFWVPNALFLCFAFYCVYYYNQYSQKG